MRKKVLPQDQEIDEVSTTSSTALPEIPEDEPKSVDLDTFCRNLEQKIKDAYEQSITISEAESLAGEFLHAQMVIARALAVKSLDSRMRKAGVKAIRGAAYMALATSGERKPSDVMIEAQVDQDKIVLSEQACFDASAVKAEELQNYLKIAEQAHVYFRQQSRSNG